MRLTISAGIGYISYTPMENPCLGLCLTWAITPGLTGKGCMGGAWVTMGTENPAGWLRLPLEKTAQNKPLVNYAPQQGHGQIQVISVERWDHAFKVRHFVLKQTGLHNPSLNAEKHFKYVILVLKRTSISKKNCYVIIVSSMKSTYLAWWEDKEGGQVGMSQCTQTDHSQLLELSRDAAQRRLTGL